MSLMGDEEDLYPLWELVSLSFAARLGSRGEEGNPLPVAAHKIVLGVRIKEMEEIEFSLEGST